MCPLYDVHILREILMFIEGNACSRLARAERQCTNTDVCSAIFPIMTVPDTPYISQWGPVGAGASLQ